MHARNRTWLLGSDPAERCRQRTMPVEGGDGSTLTLDFTTGVLDPRLTFTRLSDATFINSSGLVQWANANIVLRSEDCANWVGAQNINPTADAAIAPNGTQTADQLNLSDASYRYQATAASKVIGGQRYTGSIYVRAVSGTAQVNLRIANSADGNNGVAVTQTVGETWTRLHGSFILASTGTLIDIGLDQRTGIPNAGPGVAANVYVWGLQLQPGGTAGEYLQTTTTENYNTPRFDYDQTTLAPKGLLIEGSATNLVTQSSAMNNWTFTRSTASTPSVTAPDGASTSVLVTGTADVNNHLIQNANSISFTPQNYTFSVWLKAGATNFAQLSFTNSVGFPTNTFVNVNLSNGTLGAVNGSGATATISTAYPNGWYRVTLTANQTLTTSHTGSCLIYLVSSITAGRAESWNASSASVYVFGAQLEAGSGASSYIPTGASQGSRAADNCVTAIGNLTGFNANQGTIYESWRDNTASDTTVVQEWAFAFGLSGLDGCGVFVSNAASGTFGFNGGVSNTGDAGPTGTYVIEGVNKAAIAINVATTSLRLSANGSAVSAGTNIAGYNGAQTFALGQRNNNFRYLNGWISQFKYWPYVLPDAQLTTLTTL